MKYSIVIPTYNHLVDFLQPCCESLQTTTSSYDAEIIIVANGCTDNTEEYICKLGSPFKLLSFSQSLGYTRAVNEGLKVASGEFIILLNNDVVLKDPSWIDMLRVPFDRDPLTGITGPLKFYWNCGGIRRSAIAFWCCMFRKTLIEEIGLLDEIYNPGMGEDGDFSIKAQFIGYKLVQVPVDKESKFGTRISDNSFPIWHKGNGTFADIPDVKDSIIARNNRILDERFANRLEKIYDIALHHECDINTLFPVLRKYAGKCRRITEFGVRGVFSTYAFLAARPEKMVSYDIYTSPNINEAVDVARENHIDFKFIEQDVLKTEIEETDLLFIDTLHTYKQLSQELTLHGNKARKFILLHDTFSCGEKDEIETETVKKGLLPAIKEFTDRNPHWKIIRTITESNGLIILERKNMTDTKTVKFSIVVPCSGSTSRECVDRILKYTTFENKELIIVANGCEPGTVMYFQTSLPKTVTVINLGEKKGQIMPVINGYKCMKGEFLVLIDDDTVLLEQPMNNWIDRLYDPFKNDPKVGISGPFSGDYPYLGRFLHSGCTMYSKKILDEVGGFDEGYGFGYLYDVDVSAAIQKKYIAAHIGDDGTFPIYHPASPVSTETKKEQVRLMRQNRERLYRKHSKKPRFSIIIPTYNHLDDCLRPCLESLKQYTVLDDIEVLVVANGCKDGTADFVDSLGYPFKLVWFDDGLGFTKATNEGIKAARGDLIVLLNNDTQILDKGLPKGTWIKMLEEPFLRDDKVGITGPLQLHDNYADANVMIFFCVMIRKEVFDRIGLLDESFSPGGGEDIAFCIEAEKAGFKQIVVPDNNLTFTFTNEGRFPIYHIGEGTFSNKEFPEYGKRIVKENGFKNMIKYNQHIRLNLGSGGVEIPGYISVDKFDERASVVMDVLDLKLPENSVEELIASHLFEHINPYHSVDVLKNWHRILKPSGKLVMELPNIEELCKEFLKTDKGGRYGVLNCIYGSVNTSTADDPSKITAPHLFGWNIEILKDHLEWAGFTEIVFGPEQIPHPLSHCNMRVEARKPPV